MDVPRGAFLVDLGCGPGADLPRFARAVGPAGRVLGIDHDASAVDAALGATSSYPQVQVVQGDVHRLELSSASVDRIHTDRVLQHVADPSAVVAEVAHVLRPGGVAAFAEPDWDTLVIDFPEPATVAGYRRFVTERVVRNPRIGRHLPALCERHGLTSTRVLPVTAVFRDAQDADRVLGFRRVTERAVEAGYLSRADGAAWLARLGEPPFFASAGSTPAGRRLRGER